MISFAYNDAASITSCTLTERPVFPLFVRTGHLRAPFKEKQIQHLYPVRYSGHNQLHKMNIYVLKIGIQFIWEETTGNYPSSSQVCSFLITSMKLNITKNTLGELTNASRLTKVNDTANAAQLKNFKKNFFFLYQFFHIQWAHPVQYVLNAS